MQISNQDHLITRGGWLFKGKDFAADQDTRDIAALLMLLELAPQQPRYQWAATVSPHLPHLKPD